MPRPEAFGPEGRAQVERIEAQDDVQEGAPPHDLDDILVTSICLPCCAALRCAAAALRCLVVPCLTRLLCSSTFRVWRRRGLRLQSERVGQKGAAAAAAGGHRGGAAGEAGGRRGGGGGTGLP